MGAAKDSVAEELRKEITEVSTRDLLEQASALNVLKASFGWKLHCELLAVQVEQRNEILDFPLNDELGIYQQEYVKGEKMAYRSSPLFVDVHLEAIEDEIESRKPLDEAGTDNE